MQRAARLRRDWNDGRRRWIQYSSGSAAMVTGSLGFLLAYALLNEVLCGADGVRRTADRHPTVARTRCVNALLRYLDIGAAKMLNLQQSLTAWPKYCSHYVFPYLQLGPSILTKRMFFFSLIILLRINQKSSS